MSNNNNNKIFKHNLNNNAKIINFKTKKDQIGNNKYLPSFSKEWKNTVYSFDKNTLSNIPSLTENINKILKGYFNLFFKYPRNIGIFKFILLRRRRNFLRRIFISNAEIKHTNDKMVITLYTLNREKNILKKKYLRISNEITKILLNKFFLLYNTNLRMMYRVLVILRNQYVFDPSVLRKKTYLKSKFENLNKLQKLKNLYLRKIWSKLVYHYLDTHLTKLRKYNLLYSLNQFKFNRFSLLSVLSTVLKKILPKKIEYNIINLKYFTNSPDIFTNIIALKLKRKRISRLKEMSRVLNRTHLPIVNTIQERTFVRKTMDSYKNKYKDLKIISNLQNPKFNNLDSLLKTSLSENNEISKNIYQSIKYKNIAGVRIEVKGRLTKRYRADRSVYSLRWKGGLKNIDSSFQRMNAVLWRGNVNSNTCYAISTSKRRIGAFAVKGWLGGK